MMQLSKTDRVYMNDVNMYGNIVRTGILGLKKSDSLVILGDNGVMKAYSGNCCCSVISASTSTNKSGEKFNLPLDVKTIGADILTDAKVPKLKQMKIFSNYLGLTSAEQRVYTTKWESISNGSDSEKKKFMLNMVTKLDI